jgi:arylsulfatase
METIDDETCKAAKDFIKKSNQEDKPFFCWFNTTHMHAWTHVKPKSKGQAGRWQSEYHDTMIDHDKNVGEMLDLLDELGLAEDTFVMYSTDNGPHMNTWPDGAMTPFRNEKNSNWEGAFRIPALFRWPGHIKPRTQLNGIMSHLDMFPTIVSIAGDSAKYKVHLDGQDLSAYLSGETNESPRKGFIYFNDDGEVVGLRFDNWKAVFMEQRITGTLRVWADPFIKLRAPKIFNLRIDPFERADVTSNTYYDWMFRRVYILGPAQKIVGDFMATFKEFPPSQKPGSFTIEQTESMMSEAMGGGLH